MTGYQRRRWYIERPLPLLPIVCVGIPALLIVSAVTLGIWWWS